MEYHIMVFQTLCKHFALPVIWRLSFFVVRRNGSEMQTPCRSEPARDSGVTFSNNVD
jgi:hypothetical protein